MRLARVRATLRLVPTGVMVAVMVTAGTTALLSAPSAAAPSSTSALHEDLVQSAPVQPQGSNASPAGVNERSTLLRTGRPNVSTASVNWTPLGPTPELGGYGSSTSGRVTGLAVTPGASPTLYLASAGGGVWSSTNGGRSWATKTDSQPNLAMGSIALDPSNASYIFAGTGEANQCVDCHSGDGMMESRDGGATWTTSNPGDVFSGQNIGSISVEPGASSLSVTTVLAGASYNLYVSSDGGATWNPEAGTGWVAGLVSSIVLNPLTSPETIYAWVQNVGVEMSADNGTTWTTIEAAGSTSLRNIGALAIAPNVSATSTVLYDSVGSTTGYVGMYKSVDGGATWTLETNCTTSTSNCIPYFTSFNYAYQNQNNDTGIDQSWYDNTISIDPLNTNIVVAGGVTAVESIDGGANWVNLGGSGSTTFSKIHPDFHALAFDSAGNLYMGNDGGVWEMSTANLTSQTLNYTNLNSNLDITQFYPGISQTNNASDIVAGSQDNGTVQYLSTSPPASAWNQVDGGDGGAVAIDPSNPNFQVAESNISLQGSLDATSNDWQTTTPLTVPPFVSTNWFSPLAIVPNTLGPTILFGGDGVYLSSDGGQTWSSPTGYGASNVSALAIAPSNPSVIYAGFSDGTIQMSSDAGTTWTTVDNINNDVTHLAVSASDPFTLYVSGAVAYTGVVSWAGPPQVLMGTALDTASPSWTDLSGNLPSNDQTNTVISDGNGGLIVANEMGVYWTNTIQGTSTNWARLGAGLPNVQVMDLLLTSGGTLIAATHGRGMWTLPFSIVTNTSTTVCTWAGGTGSSGSDWSVGANWVTTAGSSCTGAGGPPTGAQVVFPANPLNTSVTWDSGTESGSGGVPANSFDSITIQSAAYVFANANAASAITLSPTVATPSCGASATIALCAAFPSGTLTLPFDFALTGFSEIASKYAASTLDVTGALSGAGSTLVIGDVSNVGVVSLSATSDGFTSGVVVNGGMLNVSGTITNSSITVQSGTTLDVSGTVGSITNDGGTISPELSPTTPGTLTTLGNVDLQALGTGQLDVLLAGSTPGTGYSQLLVNSGSINLDDATLIVNRVFTPAGGSNIVLVSLTGGATTTGTFLGLADGATIVVNGLTFVVSYPSQDGGDPTQGVLLTPLTAPDAPTIGTVTSASTTASVAWSAPASNGGVAITGYVVTAADATSSTNGGQTCTWTSGPLTCSLSGLTYGDSYTFSVTATNTIGTSGASASSNAVTPLPNPPGPVTVTFAARSSTLSPVARRALLGLSKKLIAQASLKITAYAPKNAALAHRRGRAVTLYLTSLVKVGVVIVARTTGSANKAIVVTIKE